jgi:hypothetical protein
MAGRGLRTAMTAPACLRCEGAPALTADVSPPDIAFFTCPRCGRRYAQSAGGQLTFRWGHPISFALYPMIFVRAPAELQTSQVDTFVADYPPETLEAAVAEIRLELETPTQQVRDILECPAPEAELRDYLRRFCERADVALAARDGPPSGR